MTSSFLEATFITTSSMDDACSYGDGGREVPKSDERDRQSVRARREIRECELTLVVSCRDDSARFKLTRAPCSTALAESATRPLMIPFSVWQNAFAL